MNLQQKNEPIKKDGRIKGSKGLNLIGQHNQQKSPEIPRKPPVTAEMKMEEIQHMIDDDEDFDDSILEHDFDDFDDQSHLYHETDSFYFQGEFQVNFHEKEKSQKFQKLYPFNSSAEICDYKI